MSAEAAADARDTDANDRATSGAGLKRVLGVRDLILLYVTAILGFRWLSTAAQMGASSLTLWVLAALLFFIPTGFIVAELSARLPGDGGPNLWTRAAFGETHGFIAGWCYLVTNLVFLPSLLLYTSQAFFLIGGQTWQGYGENPLLSGGFSLVFLWAATLLNIVGLKRGSWLTTIGAQGTYAILAMLGVGGALALMRHGSATPIDAGSLVPDLASPASIANLATIALAYAGLEVGSLMGGEIREP